MSNSIEAEVNKVLDELYPDPEERGAIQVRVFSPNGQIGILYPAGAPIFISPDTPLTAIRRLLEIQRRSSAVQETSPRSKTTELNYNWTPEQHKNLTFIANIVDFFEKNWRTIAGAVGTILGILVAVILALWPTILEYVVLQVENDVLKREMERIQEYESRLNALEAKVQSQTLCSPAPRPSSVNSKKP